MVTTIRGYVFLLKLKVKEKRLLVIKVNLVTYI